MARLKGGAVVEIRTAVGASRPADTWTAITCQVTEARTATGASRSSGVLTQGEPGQLELSLYDPDRLLDPANAASPYVALLKPGLWLRLVFNDGTPTIIKQGYLDSLEYNLGERTGRIRANDWTSWAANYQVPNATGWVTLGSYNRIYDLGVALINYVNLRGGNPEKIPFAMHPSMPSVPLHAIEYPQAPVDAEGNTIPGPIPLGPSIWEHLAGSGEAYLFMVYMTADLLVTAVDATVAHGPRVTIGCTGLTLLDFESRIDPSLVYNATTTTYGGTDYWRYDAASASVYGEKRYTPPRPIPFNMRFDGNSYGTAVIDDRKFPSLEAVPLRIYPANATELRQLLAITPMQQVRMYVDTPALDIYARAIGAEVGVTPEGWEVKLVTYVKPGDAPLAADESLVFELAGAGM